MEAFHGTAEIVIDGEHLTLEDVYAVARQGAKVRLSPDCFEQIDRSRALVEKILAEGRRVYGISTGFGEFSKISIGREQSGQLQENLILSHCVAVGDPLSEDVVRAMMLLRANALSKGFSGIRRELIQCLIDMLNAGVHPVIPQQGSLGASGDLAPLAHMALVLLGRGEAFYKGKRMPGAQAMEQAGLPTYHLLDATIGWTGRINSDLNINVFATGRNLTNALYFERGVDGANHDLDTFRGYPGAARTMSIGIRLQY